MGTVTEVMNKAKVPMFVGADSMVMDGGLAKFKSRTGILYGRGCSKKPKNF